MKAATPMTSPLLTRRSLAAVAAAAMALGGLGLAEVQKLFADSRWHVDTVELLNLDGGGSAQLYVKSGKFEEWLPGTSEVPVAIGFFSKPK